jgi:hypothetical protein
VSVDWGTWSAFDGAPGRPLHEVDRKTAERYFDELMSARQERKEQLEELLERNGVEIGTDDGGLQRLNDWYRSEVRASPTEADRLEDRWYAVGLDIGLYLGDAMIERAPNLEWRLFTAGRQKPPWQDVSFQRPVVMGFTKVKERLYNVDPDAVLAVHGHRIVLGLDSPEDLFVQLVRTAVEQA